MEVDADSREGTPVVSVAANAFKARKKRHTRPLKTAGDEEAPTAPPPAPPPATTESTSKKDPATDSKGDDDTAVPDAGNSGSEGRGDSDEEEEEEEEISMAEILRRRKMRNKKAGGLDFVAPRSRPKPPPRGAYDDAAAEKDAIDQDVNAVVNRFTHTQGAIVNVDEHMMKFIESELQKRRLQESGDYLMDGLGDEDEPMQRTFPAPLTSTKISDRKLGKWPIRPDFRGPAIGKLQEIDLGAEHTKKNIERTEEAKRRLQAGEPLALPEPDPEEEKKRKKNTKKKRTEEDLERDRLVEEVLKESRLDIYEEPDPSIARVNPGEDYAADDRIAEQFRREFMEALLARRRGRSNHHHKKRDETRKPRGPKLGGSRAARAAMRESERQAAAAAAAGGVKR